MKASARTSSTNWAANCQANTSFAKREAGEDGPVPPFAAAAAKRGRNAALKAPSAKIARKLLGRRNDTMKASDMGPAPRTAAMMMSRRKPATRESAVKPPTEARRPITALALSAPDRQAEPRAG